MKTSVIWKYKGLYVLCVIGILSWKIKINKIDYAENTCKFSAYCFSYLFKIAAHYLYNIYFISAHISMHELKLKGGH
jgi:hypothetical protein